MSKVSDLPYIGVNSGDQQFDFVVVDRSSSPTPGFGVARRAQWSGLLGYLQNNILGVDQNLSTTASVRFISVTAALGSFTNLQVSNNFKIGGLVDTELDAGELVITNESASPQKNTTLVIRGYKDNYYTTGSRHATIIGEIAGQTPANPIPVVVGDNIFSIASGGFTGNQFTSEKVQFTGRLTFYAAENWLDNVSSTTNVGTGFYLSTHPTGIILDSFQNFQHVHIKQSWETESNTPVPNIVIGSGIEGHKTLIRSNGALNVAEGSTKLKFLNSRLTIDGVVREDVFDRDNITLLDSNKLVFIGSRRSATDLRRNAIEENDTLGRLEFRGTYLNSASITNTGLLGGEISIRATENFTATMAGTRLIVSTINSGTTLSSDRLNLSNIENVYSSNKHSFRDSDGNLIGVISTATDTISLGRRVSTSTATVTLAEGNTASTVIVGFKSYMLTKIETSQESRVRIYADASSQAADLTRSYLATVTTGVNLIAEVLTTPGNLSQLICPGVLGFNAETPTSSTIYISVTNNTSTVAPITATITILKLEL